MSTSLLYHSFGIRDHAYVRAEYREGATLFHVAPKEDALRCPACRSRAVIRKGVIPRALRALPIGHRPTWIRVPVQRVGCKSCGVIRQIDLQFADPRRSYTRPFLRPARARPLPSDGHEGGGPAPRGGLGRGERHPQGALGDPL